MLHVPDPAPDPRHLLHGVGDRVAHLGLIEARHGSGRRRGAYRGAVAFGRPAPGAHEGRLQRHEKPAAQIVAERHRSEEFGPRAALPLSHGQCRRHDDAARVRLGERMKIVRLVGMAEHPVGECRVHGRRHDIRRCDRGFGHAALSAHIVDRHLAGYQAGTRHDGRQRVENPMLRLQHGARGQRGVARAHHVAGEPACQICPSRGLRLRWGDGARVAGGQGRQSDRAACPLQNVPSR